jgi:hypothetical protein
VFAPDSSGWGRLGNTVIRLEVADEATVQVAVATAWSNVAEVGNASEADVADVEDAKGCVNTAEVVEAGCGAEAADIRTSHAAEVNATVVNAGKVADEISAAEVVNRPEVVETGDLAELVNATVVVNAEGGGEGGAAEVPNGAEVVETENAALPSVIRRQATNAGNHGERSMTLTLLAVVKRENMIDLKYGEAFDDPQPVILTVTPEYVAHETAKSVPISASDLHAYILAHAAKLRAIAENCKRRDLTSEVLQ